MNEISKFRLHFWTFSIYYVYKSILLIFEQVKVYVYERPKNIKILVIEGSILEEI